MDVKLRELEREYKNTEHPNDLIKLWLYQRRYGIEPSHLLTDQSFTSFNPSLNPDKNRGFDGCSIGPVIPGDTISLLWSPIKYVYFIYEKHIDYESDNYTAVVELEDGRFASISKNDYGTCELCSNADETISISSNLQDTIIFGLTNDQRTSLGITNP